MHSARALSAAVLAVICIGWLGCGAPECRTLYSVVPETASADHTAAYPANSVIFIAVRRVTGGCGQAAVMPTGTWSSSDNVNVHIDVDSGVATCLNATPAAVSIRFTSSNASETYTPASLTCR